MQQRRLKPTSRLHSCNRGVFASVELRDRALPSLASRMATSVYLFCAFPHWLPYEPIFSMRAARAPSPDREGIKPGLPASPGPMQKSRILCGMRLLCFDGTCRLFNDSVCRFFERQGHAAQVALGFDQHQRRFLRHHRGRTLAPHLDGLDFGRDGGLGLGNLGCVGIHPLKT